MGTIHAEVRSGHLARRPEEEALIEAFLPCFSVTWAARQKAFNADVSVYLLKPESWMLESFGLEREIMLVYSPYNVLEPRTLQAAERFYTHEPFRGRIENLTYFLASEADSVPHWLAENTLQGGETRLVVGFGAAELREHRGDDWFVRNRIREQLYGRDLFDYRLPLKEDTYFFGRTDIAASLFDTIIRCENRGLFGLRKTGKTSLLYKVERMLRSDGRMKVAHYDCKLPSVRMLRWFELLERIARDLCGLLGVKAPKKLDERTATDGFLNAVASFPKPALLVLDEIEFISPVAVLDKHWHEDFVSFWQTIWGAQSEYRTLSTLVAGVNPSVAEIDQVAGVQNPLFGIVSTSYLTGLSLDETRSMIRRLGRRMGLKFSENAVRYVHERYGGHPLLTRMACSVENSFCTLANEQRPIEISSERLVQNESMRDSELVFYCRHVVSELADFYPDEYSMLEMLASGQIHDFMELSTYPEFTKHLRSYGLLQESNGRPLVSVPVIRRYVALELARQEGRQTLLRVVPEGEREPWLEKRKRSISSDLKLLESTIQSSSLPELFGPNSYPDSDKFLSLSVVKTESDFEGFINACHKCFVESIESLGKSKGDSDYYWDTIRKGYPGLWRALQRIRLYRHERMHLRLTSKASRDLLSYLQQDLEGRSLASLPDGYFILQQCVLDDLLTGIQVETGALM